MISFCFLAAIESRPRAESLALPPLFSRAPQAARQRPLPSSHLKQNGLINHHPTFRPDRLGRSSKRAQPIHVERRVRLLAHCLELRKADAWPEAHPKHRQHESNTACPAGRGAVGIWPLFTRVLWRRGRPARREWDGWGRKTPKKKKLLELFLCANRDAVFFFLLGTSPS